MQNSNICPVCNTSFSRRDALLRHKKNKHSEITENYPPGIPFETSKELSIMTPLNRPQFKFQHPCSVVLTGPSGSGKSVLTKKILCQSFIQPPPQRIIWCYGQYQPLYDNVKKNVPGVEFVKGIPDFIEHDTYLDTSVRNCIILDDLMGDAKKDERVANLFTKGSHHRNLTVFYLTQNLFPQGKSSRDISLNTKYLVLFNNPVDRIQVANLARRIYPTNSHLFMNTYKRAVEIPYGHLIVDLRANTKEQDRLCENILNRDMSINTDMTNVIRGTPSYQNQMEQLSDESDIDMPTCDDCGIMFGDDYALQKHVKQWCVARKTSHGQADFNEWPKDDISDDEEYMDTSRRKRQKIEEMDKSIYLSWINPVVKSVWKDRVDEKEEELGSRDKAVYSMLPEIRKTGRQTVANLLIDFTNMKKDVFYQTIMATAESLVDNNKLTLENAIRQSVKMHKEQINELLIPSREESDDESDDDRIEVVSSEEED